MQVNASVFTSFPMLKTERLTLRNISPEDAEEIFKMRSNGSINRFIARPEMADIESAKQLVEKVEQAYSSKAGIGWAGILRENDRIIGTCGFNSIDYPNLRAEIGGELATAYWGKNIALEAVTAIVNFGLEVLNLHSIEAKVSPGNRGAIYLLERLGFEKEAHYRDRVYFQGKFQDMAVYTLIKA